EICRSSSCASNCPFLARMPGSAMTFSTNPSRCAATSTWFSTTRGPEATKKSGAGGGRGAADALGRVTPAAGVGLVSLQPIMESARAASSVAANPRFIAIPPPRLPAKPGPELRVEPHGGATEQHVTRRMPAHRDLAPSLHAAANLTLRVGHPHPRKEHPFISLHAALGADHLHRTSKCTVGVAVQLQRRAIAGAQQRHLGS